MRPISERKLEKSLHRSQMVIPLPPHNLKECWFGFMHRCLMLCQALYSEVVTPFTVSPCVFVVASKLSRATSFWRHPQLLVFPFISDEDSVTTIFPQSHKHSHNIFRLGATPMHLFATSRENLTFFKSFANPMMCILPFIADNSNRGFNGLAFLVSWRNVSVMCQRRPVEGRE